jgi:hypothetical protein
MAKLVTALFRSRAAAMLAMEDLVRHGYSQDDISLLMSESTRGREFKVNEATKAPEGMATGAAIGGALGALLLGLTAVGTIVAPGLGLVAAGHWLTALAGFGAGALGGGLIGGLAGMGIPEHEAEIYRGELEKGGILLGIFAPTDERAREAQRLMEANNAEHLHCTNTKEEAVAK